MAIKRSAVSIEIVTLYSNIVRFVINCGKFVHFQGNAKKINKNTLKIMLAEHSIFFFAFVLKF